MSDINIEDRIKLCIGDLVIKLQVATAKIEELDAELKKRDEGTRHEGVAELKKARENARSISE